MKLSQKKWLAEFLGTYLLVFVGTGAMVINDVTNGAVSHVGVAICWGLIVTTMIYSFGELSGAHINPAVSIAFWMSGDLQLKQLLPYLIVQFLGALAASASLWALFPGLTVYGDTLPAGAVSQTFFLEVILTFILMLVIFRVAKGSKQTGQLAGFVIGFVVLFEAMFAGPITGASMNPARSLGPAIISGNLSTVWIYLVAPILGASIAVLFYKLLKQSE